MSEYFPDKVFHGKPKPNFMLVLRKVMRGEQLTRGGVILPPGADEQSQPTCLGMVMAVGEGVEDFKPGDNVVFNPYPMRGISIALRGGAEAQVFLHEDDAFGTYTLDDPADEDIEHWKAQDEEKKAYEKPRLVMPDNKIQVP